MATKDSGSVESYLSDLLSRLRAELAQINTRRADILAAFATLEKAVWSLRLVNIPQTTEKTRFAELLHGLCAGIIQPAQEGRGQRQHRLSDVVFAGAMKVYSRVSGRRSMSDLRDYMAKGYLTKVPHYNSIFFYLEDTGLTLLLKTLIEESASPLEAIEQDFNVDASDFSTSTFNRWFDEHGTPEATLRRKYINCRLASGVKTHVVTSVEVTDDYENDSPNLPTNSNSEAIEATEAAPYIPFWRNSRGEEGPELWRRMFHYFQFEREAFLKHYHKRANVETAFSMIKTKFGGSVRAKTPTAQKNEVLLKVLCHNLCCLVQAIYELGLVSTFWPEEDIGKSTTERSTNDAAITRKSILRQD